MLFYSFQSRLSCCHTVDVHIYIYVVTGKGAHTSCPYSYLPGVEAVHRETNNSMGCARTYCCMYARPGSRCSRGTLFDFIPERIPTQKHSAHQCQGPSRERDLLPARLVYVRGYKEQTVFSSRSQKSRGHILFLLSILGYLFLHFRFLMLFMFLF